MADKTKPAPPGWYPHPDMAETRRYWDGGQWTEHIAPATVVTEFNFRGTMSAAATGVLLLSIGLGIIAWAVIDQNRDDPAPTCSSESMDPYSVTPPC